MPRTISRTSESATSKSQSRTGKTYLTPTSDVHSCTIEHGVNKQCSCIIGRAVNYSPAVEHDIDKKMLMEMKDSVLTINIVNEIVVEEVFDADDDLVAEDESLEDF